MYIRRHWGTYQEYSKSKPPRSTSDGSSQVGSPRKTSRGEPRKRPNENCIPIKTIHQCRTSEGDYCRGISRGTPTSAPSKTKCFSTNQKQELNSYVHPPLGYPRTMERYSETAQPHIRNANHQAFMQLILRTI